MPESAHTSGRSAYGRASDTLPFKPYVYRGGGEPPAVTAARERWHAAHAAVAETAAPGPDQSTLRPCGCRIDPVVFSHADHERAALA